MFPKHDGAKYFKKVLKPFCDPPKCGAGGAPQSGVIMDTAGNLYGTSQGPGACGTAYEAVLSGGKYTLKALHTFTGSDGCSLTPGALAYQGKESGQLYDGTSPLFGLSFDGGANGRGAIFELTPPKPGRKKWGTTVIYSYCQITGCADGHDPIGNVLMDNAGNLFANADHAAGGSIFYLSPDGTGGFVKNPVWQFSNGESLAYLRIGSDGTLYGTASSGGPTGHGELFKLSPDGGGGYDMTDLHDFCASLPPCTDGDIAATAMVDSHGNIWGTTIGGGANPAPFGSPFTGAGVVFEYSSGGSFAVVHNFCSKANCSDGGAPTSGLVTDGAGNFFGVTGLGGVALESGIKASPFAASRFAPGRRGAPLPPPPGSGGVLYEISLP